MEKTKANSKTALKVVHTGLNSRASDSNWVLWEDFRYNDETFTGVIVVPPLDSSPDVMRAGSYLEVIGLDYEELLDQNEAADLSMIAICHFWGVTEQLSPRFDELFKKAVDKKANPHGACSPVKD